MIELKLNFHGPKKRTIIDSLKCELLKDKDKFYLMRFKSLPVNKRHSRNLVRLDLPHTVKVSEQNRQKRYFGKQKTDSSERENSNNFSQIRHRRMWTEQLERDFLQSEHSYLINKRQAAGEYLWDKSQQLKKKVKTLQSEPQKESIVQFSLRNYIRRHLSLKQSSLKKEVDEVQKVSIQHSHHLNSLKKSRNLKSTLNFQRPLLSIKNQPLLSIKTPSAKDLLTGKLSPKICQIQKIQPSRNDSRDCSVLRRERIYEVLENANTFDQKQNSINSPPKSPKKNSAKMDKVRMTKAFKNSIGPWRQSGFGGFKV